MARRRCARGARHLTPLLAGCLLACGADLQGPPAAPSASVAPPTAAAGASAPEATPSAPASTGAATPLGVDVAGILRDVVPAAQAGRRLAAGTLASVIDREAGDPRNAWALAHGMLARGAEFRATDGRLARDVLAQDWLQSEPHLHFERSRGATRVEPHQDLILKTLLEVGLPLDAPIGSEAGGPTVGALLAASQGHAALGELDSASPFPDANDAPWSVQAWCQGAAAGGPDPFAVGSRSIAVGDAGRALLGVLDREVAFIDAAVTAGRGFEKRKQGIFGFTCGGAHLFQGAAACAAVDRAGTEARAAVLAAIRTWLARVPVETALVDAAVRQHPKMGVLLVNQDVKFLGHLLESLGKAWRDGLWAPTDAERALLDRVEGRLLQRVLVLQKTGVYAPEAMQRLAGDESTFQLYLDLVGDACHAWKGLDVYATQRGGTWPPG